MEKRVEAADIKSATGEWGIIRRSAGNSGEAECTVLPPPSRFSSRRYSASSSGPSAGWQTTSYNWVGPLEAAVAVAAERISVC